MIVLNGKVGTLNGVPCILHDFEYKTAPKPIRAMVPIYEDVTCLNCGKVHVCQDQQWSHTQPATRYADDGDPYEVTACSVCGADFSPPAKEGLLHLQGLGRRIADVTVLGAMPDITGRLDLQVPDAPQASGPYGLQSSQDRRLNLVGY